MWMMREYHDAVYNKTSVQKHNIYGNYETVYQLDHNNGISFAPLHILRTHNGLILLKA